MLHGVYAKIKALKNSGNSVTIKKPSPTTNKSFLYWAEKCHNYIATNNWTYDNLHRRPKMADYFANKITHKQIDCSAYVSWVLYMYTNGKFNKSLKSYNFVSKCNSPTYFQNLGFQVIKGQVTQAICKPGDILVVNGHVEIYKGNGKSYSAGSTGCIRSKSGSSTNFKRFNYIIRPMSK